MLQRGTVGTLKYEMLQRDLMSWECDNCHTHSYERSLNTGITLNALTALHGYGICGR